MYHLVSGLDDLAKQICPSQPHDLEFHASHMMAGKGFWRSIRPKDARRAHIRQALAECHKLRGDWALFGVVVEKAAVSPRDPVEFAFEHLCARFDEFLKRQYKKGNNQRGLMIMDKSAAETGLQNLAYSFRIEGHRQSQLKNQADVPMFVDSRATRAIQFADIVSYALFQKYERGNTEFFDVISDSFDQTGGIVHGLLHQHSGKTPCDCPSCFTR